MKTCEYCGKEIKYRVETVLGNPTEIPIPCDCEASKKALEEKHKAESDAKSKEQSDRIIKLKTESGLLSLNRKMTFENFDTTRCSKVVEACKDFTGGLIIMGQVGCGKTHLACAILNKRIDEGKHGYFINFTDYLEEVRESYHGKETNVTSICKNIPLLILDDIGIDTNEFAKNKLFEIVNYRYNDEKPIIITTNLKPDELQAAIGTRTYDRLKDMCKLLAITKGSYRGKHD